MKLFSKSALTLLILGSSNQFLSTHAQQLVRFEKFNFTDDGSVLERPTITFPLDESSANYLRENSRSTSVVLSDEECDDVVNLQQTKSELSAAGLYPPSHPEDEEFWAEFAEVVNVQSHLKTKQKNPCMTDPIPQVMPAMTELWKGFGIIDVAEAVFDEFPGIYHNQMVADWLAKKTAKFNNDVIQRLSMPDFLRGPVMLSEMIGRAIRLVGPCDFTLKWSVGRARPEEVAWKIDQGILDIPSSVGDEMRQTISNSIKEMNLLDPTDFTAYPEGSPTHPSWPAMHSAASAASFWLDVIMDLTDDQLCEARMLDYSVSFARTVAGVHYEGDNISGLMVGQSILAQRLPTILNNEYGSDIEVVKNRIKDKRYDWTGFEDSDCYKEARFKTVPPPKPAFCFDKRGLPVGNTCPHSPHEKTPITKSAKLPKSSKTATS